MDARSSILVVVHQGARVAPAFRFRVCGTGWRPSSSWSAHAPTSPWRRGTSTVGVSPLPCARRAWAGRSAAKTSSARRSSRSQSAGLAVKAAKVVSRREGTAKKNLMPAGLLRRHSLSRDSTVSVLSGSRSGWPRRHASSHSIATVFCGFPSGMSFLSSSPIIAIAATFPASHAAAIDSLPAPSASQHPVARKRLPDVLQPRRRAPGCVQPRATTSHEASPARERDGARGRRRRRDVPADDALAWLDRARENGYRSRFTLRASAARGELCALLPEERRKTLQVRMKRAAEHCPPCAARTR